MKEQFVPYDIALKLKELGFNERCLAIYINSVLKPITQKPISGNQYYVFNSVKNNILINPMNCTAPLWQQAIDWFREKHNIQVLQICPIPPEAIKAAKGNLDNKKGYGFFLYNVNWNPRVPNLDVWEESFYKEREQVILKALELIK